MRASILCAAVLAALIPSLAGASDMSGWLKARQARFAAFRAAKPLTGPAEIWDRVDAPPMVVMPAGSFAMGPATGSAKLRGNELPPHQVRLDQPLAVSKYPITVGEYATFVAKTGHVTGPSCWTFEDGDGHIREGRNWRNPGIVQGPDHPVLCVGYEDVQAYAAWLSNTTGHAYRLLSEAEYEYANRAGAQAVYWWGDDPGGGHANCDGCGSVWDNKTTSPVGSFPANPFGLYDTTGNTWVWTSDCYVDAKVPLGPGGACTEHAIRGGAWHNPPAPAYSRFHHTPDTHSATLGIRLARAP